MKKILLFTAAVLLGINVFSQFLTDVTSGMTGLQTRNAINGNNTLIEDTVDYFYDVNTLNGAAIDTALARAGRVGNGNAPPYFDGSSDGGTYLQFYGANGFWTALQGGAPTANRSYRLPIQALPGAGLRAFMVIDQFGNMQFKDSADVGGGGVGDLAFADTVNGTGFLETQFRIDTAKTAIREEINAISTGSGFVETADTATMLTPYAETFEVIAIVHDSLTALFNAGEDGVALADSNSIATAHYATPYAVASGGLTRFHRGGGSLTLSGADSVTITSTANSNVTLPTSGTLTTLAAASSMVGDSLTQKVDLKRDTMEFFCFASGMGLTADTAGYQVTSNLGGWYHSGRDTIMITNIRTVIGDGPGDDTLRYQVWVNDTITTTYASKLFANADSIGRRAGVNQALTVGWSRSSFSTTPFPIPPGNHVWLTCPNVVAGRKPTFVRSTISGYKKNGQY